jgi:hypothetical protein
MHHSARKFCLLTIIILVLVTIALETRGDEVPLFFSGYRTGFELFKTGEFSQAANAWIKDGEMILKESRDRSSLKKAALANVMATIAFERGNDARAYVAWSTAIRYFLEGQTNWDEERKRIRVIINRIQSDLKAAATGEPLVSAIDEDLIDLELDSTLSFTTYNGPARGLKVRESREKLPAIHVSRDYYPKPVRITKEETESEQRIIQRGPQVVLEEKEPAESCCAPSLGRGLPISPKITTGIYPSISSKRRTSEKPGAKAGTYEGVPLVFRGRHVIPVPEAPAGRDLLKPQPSVTEPTGKKPEQEIGPEERPETLIQEEDIGKASDAPEKSSPQKILLPRMDEFVQDSFSKEDMEIARTAWQYFLHNYQANTGLVNAVHNYPYVTLWDMGSALAGFVAAEKLGIITMKDFNEKATRLLETLLSVENYNQQLPNREYNTHTGKMTDLRNRPSNKGSGWSALDIGRFLIWLKIVEEWHPNLRNLVNKLVSRWLLERVCLYQELNGALFDGKKEHYRQEGRLGYEQYCAMGYQLWGYDVNKALDYEEVEWVAILGKKIPFDVRNNPFLTSEPFMLAKIELGGLDKEFNRIINDIYEVQKRRWQETDILTAVTEDSVNQKPWFVYSCVFYEGKAWNCVDNKGHTRPLLKNLSTKAAMAWASIFSDDYTQHLRNAVITVKHPKYGFYSGIYEDGKINNSRNVNTNAVILESMLYLKRGRKPFIKLNSINSE